MFLHLFGRFFVLPPIPQPYAGNFFQTETLAITSYEPCHPLNIVHCADVSPPFFTRRKKTISDFRHNSTTEVLLLRDFKSAKICATSLFVSKMKGKPLFKDFFYSAQIKMFNYAIFTVLKRVHPQEFESL